ncbi:hypothetical protein CIPAW_06G000400 [Carya illinoinensis]|uniref:Uncharacterized protein n=1 Tax=Carya illinoinensis TaxID=32201 RepID=A0A8T1Q5P1_CARIL|nr:hypothetical protein CIPAW_06G000400 [Carya illinoinensis]
MSVAHAKVVATTYTANNVPLSSPSSPCHLATPKHCPSTATKTRTSRRCSAQTCIFLAQLRCTSFLFSPYSIATVDSTARRSLGKPEFPSNPLSSSYIFFFNGAGTFLLSGPCLHRPQPRPALPR